MSQISNSQYNDLMCNCSNEIHKKAECEYSKKSKQFQKLEAWLHDQYDAGIIQSRQELEIQINKAHREIMEK